MSGSSESEKAPAPAPKVYPIDLAQKITIIKGAAGDGKVPHLMAGPKMSAPQGQIITHALMRSSAQILPQTIVTSQPQLVSNVQSNVVVGAPTTPIIQGTQIINQGTQNSSTVVGGAVHTLPTTVTQLTGRRDSRNIGQILSLPLQQHTQIAAANSITAVKPQATISTQAVTTAKQLTSYHVPRGPAAVASLAVPRGSAGPRAPMPSPTPNWSSTGPQCYVSRPPRPHTTLQVATQRTSLRQVTPQSTTATVVARVVRPSSTPVPQRTPPPQAATIQSVSTVRPSATKVVPLVQRSFQPVKVLGVATLGVRPTISSRPVGNTYYYEVSSGIASAQPSSSAPPSSTQHTLTTGTSHLPPTSIQPVSSTSVVTQTPPPMIIQQVAIPQQQTIGLQSSVTHSTIVQQTPANLSHQNSLPLQSSLSQQIQQTSHLQPSIIQQSNLSHQIAHKPQLNQPSIVHQTPLTQLSNIAHQSSLMQQQSIVNQHQTVVQQSTSINSLPQTVIPQPTHQPLSTVNLQAHNQLTSFAGALGNNNSDLGRPPSSPGGPQRPSILRKRDNDGSPLKNSTVPPPLVSTSPPPSPGGSTTVSAASSPGPEDDEPPLPMFTHIPQSQHVQQAQHQTTSITQVITQQHNMTQNILQAALQPSVHQNDQQSYNNYSPRKKPRKQLLPSETRNIRSEECEFPPEANISINNVQATILSPPHGASPPITQPQPVEREKPPRRALLGAGWKCGWKATALHFTKPSDVKRREDRRPSVVELAAQRHVQQKANGWKIHHLTAQMDDLCELENNALEITANILKMLESKQHMDHHRILELLKGNIQRTKLVSEGVGEAKSNVLRVFQHKSHVSDILARQADKRCFKKHRNQC